MLIWTVVPAFHTGRKIMKSHRLLVLGALITCTLLATGCDDFFLAFVPIPTSSDPAIQTLVAPAPKLPIGSYDYFGQFKSAEQARQMVIDAGLDPSAKWNFSRIGLIEITEQLIADGKHRFFNQALGDPSSVGQIFATTNNFGVPDLSTLGPVDPAVDPTGLRAFRRSFFLTLLFRPRFAETNLKIRLDSNLLLGHTVFPAGSEIATGLDIPVGETVPIGIQGGSISCAACHASVDPTTGAMVTGAPNTDLNIGFFLALSNNTTSSFLRFNKSQIDPLDGRFPLTGRRIFDSNGNVIQLPDPAAFEAAIDDIVLTIPLGGFESVADGTTAETKIPDSFVFGEGGMGWDGGFQIGPFGGVAALSSAVHALEVNFLGPANLSKLVANLDPEVYLGIVLQNAGDPKIRLPDDVKPSDWLKQAAPSAERSSLVELPGYPSPSLFSLNGLAFSPPDEPFLYSAIALSAFQASLTVPPNKSIENRWNLRNGAVLRGADVFRAANCNSCHAAPFFTNNRVVPNTEIKASPRRAKARQLFDGLFVNATLPSFDQMVPLPAVPNLLTLPPDPGAANNLLLPPGLDNPDGGYKVIGLLGTYLKAPYLHDGGVAATLDAIRTNSDGTYTLLRPAEIGIPGTTRAGRRIHPANSLRVLLDRELRAICLLNNATDPTLVINGVEGTGHEFFVDPTTGFNYGQQTDLIAYLLSLDDNPGQD